MVHRKTNLNERNEQHCRTQNNKQCPKYCLKSIIVIYAQIQHNDGHDNKDGVSNYSATFNTCIKCVDSPGLIHVSSSHTIATHFLGHGCMDDLTTERSFDLQATRVIGILGLFFDMFSTMGVCTTRHCQTSGRPVQELNVCTVE